MQDIQNIFTTQNIIIYFIIINIIGFLIMYIDKQKAKKGKWRIPEKTLFIITALGGGIGTIANYGVKDIISGNKLTTEKLELLKEKAELRED